MTYTPPDRISRGFNLTTTKCPQAIKYAERTLEVLYVSEVSFLGDLRCLNGVPSAPGARTLCNLYSAH